MTLREYRLYRFYDKYEEHAWLSPVVSFGILFYTFFSFPIFPFLPNLSEFFLRHLGFYEATLFLKALIFLYFVFGILVASIRSFRIKEWLDGLVKFLLFILPFLLILYFYIFTPIVLFNNFGKPNFLDENTIQSGEVQEGNGVGILDVKKFAGTYKNGLGKDGARGSLLVVYPKSETSVLIYLESSTGAPSYNSGALYRLLQLDGEGKGIISEKNEYDDLACNLSFAFAEKEVTIRGDGVGEPSGCPFGYGVFVSGTYLKTDQVIPQYFIDRKGQKIYFEDTNPEEYLF